MNFKLTSWLACFAALSVPVIAHSADVQLPVDEYKSLQVTTPGLTDRYARHRDALGSTEPVNASSEATLKKDATFRIVRGLGNGDCYSLESQNYPGQFLRHANSRIRKDPRDGSDLFDRDATWCARPGLSGVGVSFESLNYPGRYLRHANAELWLAQHDGGGSFSADASWNVANAWSSGFSNGCNAVTWQRGVYYQFGDIVQYSNGSYYKLVNVGSNGSDGTDPTISTWYWSPTSCDTGGGGGGSGGPFVVSEAQFNQMFPNRNPLYTYNGLVSAMSAYPAFATTGGDTVQRQEAAAFLANVAHESDSLKATREYNTANWPLYCSGDCAPGQQYYGRGPIQLSWNYNYRAAGQAIGVDLWSNPDLVATDATVAWKTAIWYWMTGTGNAGVTPHTAMVNAMGFGVTIQAINGSLECNGGRPDQVQTRVNFYNSFTGIIGVTPGANLYC